MKAFAISLTTCALLAGAAALSGASAQPAAPSPALHATSAPLTDVSSKSKKRKHYQARHYGYYGAPVYGPPVYSMWRGADPSYGPGTAQMRQYQREGRCVIDEGYGRYSFCSNR